MPSSANGSMPFGSVIETQSQPGILAGQRAQAERAGDDSDQDEADDRIDPEAGEGGNDDPRRAEDDQRVAERRGHLEFAGHAAL